MMRLQTTITQIAREAGLDTKALSNCIGDAKARAAVEGDIKAAMALGLNGTPAFIVGANTTSGKITGRALRGAYPFEEFQAAIAAAQGATKAIANR